MDLVFDSPQQVLTRRVRFDYDRRAAVFPALDQDIDPVPVEGVHALP
jgi:hypothetical protein